MGANAAGRVLGLDLGDVRIGVAISDPDRRVAVPIGTIHVGSPPGELFAIAELVREHDVALVVIGEPMSMDGTRGDAGVPRSRVRRRGPGASRCRCCCRTSVSRPSRRPAACDAGASAKRQRAVIDAAAAQVILQAWLEIERGSTEG